MANDTGGATPDGDLRAAAHEALARRAWDEAYRLFAAADAQRKLGGPDLEGFAEAARWSSRFAEVIELLERAEAAHLAAGDGGAAARVALHCAVEHHSRGNMTVAVGCTLRARTLLEEEPEGGAHAFLEWCMGRAAMEHGDFAAARPHLDAAVTLARRHRDRDVEALGKHDLGHLDIAEGRPDEGQSLVDEAVALALSGALRLNVAGVIYCGTIWACRNAATSNVPPSGPRCRRAGARARR